jgi:hypothetical protein
MPDVFSTIVSSLHKEVGAILASPVLKRDADPLELLRASIAVQAQVASLVSAAVEQARDAGCTWLEIGDILGISRQAAFQRFGKPVDPRTGEAMNTTPMPEAVTLAETVVDDFAQAKWGQIIARFDATMSAAVSDETLAVAWAQIIGSAGSYERRGEVEALRAGDLTITNTPMAFEAGDFTARITFRDDQSIAGLYIVPSETAV